MSDIDMVVKKGGDSNTLSDKELDAAVLPPDQPVNKLTSYVDSDTLSVKELGASLPPPYKHAGFTPPPLEHPYTNCEWIPVCVGLPITDPDEVERIYKDFYDAFLPELLADDPESDVPAVPPVDGLMSPNMFDYLPPSQIEYQPFICPQYTPCPPYSPPAPGGYDLYRSLDTFHAQPLLFARIALHCYNLDKGTHFERLGLPGGYNHTIEARDPVRNYTCKFETNVRLATVNKDCFHVITTRCRPFPPPPGEDRSHCGFDTLSVDELFKGNMPDDYATSTLLMQCYEMKESEVEQAKDWLHLYAELALYTKMQTDPFMFERAKPLELGKVVVQTRDSLTDVKLSDNAVFFITFTTSGGDVCKGIIRRTRDGIPEHLSLEAKCFMSCESR